MPSTPQVSYWLLKHLPESEEASAAGSWDSDLSAGELARAARFHFSKDAARYRFFHQCLRKILAAALPGHPSPASLEFFEGPQGKPFLRQYPNLHFNLTHTQEFGAIAISECGPVGIDLEREDVDFPCREVAQNYFHGGEVAAVLEAATPIVATRRFFQFWTAKEAVMKATGLGMTLEPQQIALQLDSETQLPLGVQSLRTTHSVEAEWKLHFPEVEPGLILAIATRPEVLNVLEMKLQTGIP